MVRKTKKRDNKNRTSRKKMRYNKAGKTRKMSGGGFMNFMKRQLSKVGSKVGSKIGVIMDSHGISKTINDQHNVNEKDCTNFTNLNRHTRNVLTAFEKLLNDLKTTDTNEHYHKYYTDMYEFYFNTNCTNLVKAINDWTAMSNEDKKQFGEIRLYIYIGSSTNIVNSRFFMFAMKHYLDNKNLTTAANVSTKLANPNLSEEQLEDDSTVKQSVFFNNFSTVSNNSICTTIIKINTGSHKAMLKTYKTIQKKLMDNKSSDELKSKLDNILSKYFIGKNQLVQLDGSELITSDKPFSLTETADQDGNCSLTQTIMDWAASDKLTLYDYLLSLEK